MNILFIGDIGLRFSFSWFLILAGYQVNSGLKMSLEVLLHSISYKSISIYSSSEFEMFGRSKE
jgi:hypothetical protein